MTTSISRDVFVAAGVETLTKSDIVRPADGKDTIQGLSERLVSAILHEIRRAEQKA